MVTYYFIVWLCLNLLSYGLIIKYLDCFGFFSIVNTIVMNIFGHKGSSIILIISLSQIQEEELEPKGKNTFFFF